MKRLLALVLILAPACMAQRTITNTTGGTVTNQPVSIMSEFVQGNIPNCVNVFWTPPGGASAAVATTQTDVKTKWPDGSLKTAVVSFIIPSLAAGATGTVYYDNQVSCNNTGFATQANLLSTTGSFPGNAGPWNFDAQIVLTGTVGHTISARTMLTAASSCVAPVSGDIDGALATNQCVYWLQGPIVTAVLIEDRTRGSDVNTDGTGSCPVAGGSNCPLHPMFEAWFYPQTGQVEIGYALEDDWISATATNSARDQTYGYTLTAGTGHTTMRTQTAETVLTRTRWHHRYCGIGTGAGTAGSCNFASLNFNYNWPYLSRTKIFPNWDSNSFTLSLGPGQQGLTFGTSAGVPNPTTFFNAWTNAGTNKTDTAAANTTLTQGLGFLPNVHGSCGNSSQTTTGDGCSSGGSQGGMNSGGAAYYHGPFTTWDIVTLLTQDPNMIEVVTPQSADAAGGVPWWFREADNHTQIGRFFDSPNNTVDTLGRIVSINARTQFDTNDSTPNFCSTNVASQQVAYGGAGLDIGTWNSPPSNLDVSHWPETSFVAYALTGYYQYYEQMIMQAGNAIGNSSAQGACVAAGNPARRQGAFGYVKYDLDQDREVTWALREFFLCGVIAMDGSPEQAYCLDKLNANLAVIEGQNNITCNIVGTGVAQPYCGAGSGTAWGFGNTTRNVYPTIGAVYGNLFSGTTAYVGAAPSSCGPPPGISGNCTPAYSEDANFMNAYMAVTMGWIDDLGYCPHTNGVCPLVQWESNGYISKVMDPNGPGLGIMGDYVVPTIGGTAGAQQGITNMACATTPCTVASGSMYPYFGDNVAAGSAALAWPRTVAVWGTVNSMCADEGYAAQTTAGLSFGYPLTSTVNSNAMGTYNGTVGYSGLAAYNAMRTALFTQCTGTNAAQQPPFIGSSNSGISVSPKWDILPRAVITTPSLPTFPWSTILSSTRAVPWGNAGVVNSSNGLGVGNGGVGIPSANWTQCGATIAAYTGLPDAINTQLAGCAPNTYVLLGPGTFNLSGAINNGGIHIVAKDHIALRGTESNGILQTTIVFGNYDGCQGLQADVCFVDVPAGSANIVTPNGANQKDQPGGAGAADWTGTTEGGAGVYPQGATHLTVARVGSNAIHLGQYINLDQADNPMPTTGGFNSCTQVMVQTNGCVLEGPSGGGRTVPSGLWSSATSTASGTLAGNVLNHCSNASVCGISTFPTDGTWTGMNITLFQPNSAGTPYFTTIQSVTDANNLVLNTPLPAPGDGPYSWTIGSGTATLVASTNTLTYVAGRPFSLTQLAGGQVIFLYRNNILYSVKVASVTDANHIVLASSPPPGDGSYTYASTNHGQQQIVQVTGISGTGCTLPFSGAGPCTLTITPGLYAPTWNTANGPGIWFSFTSATQYVGIENITLDHSNSSPGANVEGIVFLDCYNCWVRNVRSIRPQLSHTRLTGSTAHITVENSYFYDSRNAATQSYGLETFGTSDSLFRNNICQHIVTCAIAGSQVGTVFADNFNIDNYVNQNPAITITNTSQSGNVQTYIYTPATTLTAGVPISIAGTTNGNGVFNHTNAKFTIVSTTSFTITCGTQAVCGSATINSATENGLGLTSNGVMSTMFVLHDPGDMYNLYEGNIGNGSYMDIFHGQSLVNTFFRNYFTGFELNKFSALIPIKEQPYNRYQNLIGNVLGTPTIQTTYDSYPSCQPTCAFSNDIYYLAPLSITEAQTPPTLGFRPLVQPDQAVHDSLMRWGNYDTVSSPSIRFVASEVPSTDAFGFANPVPASTTLPASFWQSSAPSYNVTPGYTVPFPAIGSDVTAVAPHIAIAPDLVGTNLAPGNHAYTNAAEQCYNTSPIDPAYPLGMDRGVLLFNGNNCYGTGTPPPPTPTATLGPNLFFGNQNINTTSNGLSTLLTNTGTVDVVVVQAQLFGTNFTVTNLGTCFTVFGSNTSFTLHGGQSCTWIITFSPTATISYSGTFQVTDNATGSPQSISLSGQGTQATISWSSPQGGTTYNYGNVLISLPTNSAPLTLTNTGTGPLNVNPSITGANQAQFIITSNSCPTPLPAQNSCTFTVTFTPAAAASYTAALTETDSLASNSPQSLTLNGTGVTTIPITAPWPIMTITRNRSPRHEISDDSCNTLHLGWCVSGTKPATSERFYMAGFANGWSAGL